MVAKKDSQKIRISVKAFDHRLLDEAVQKIVAIAKVNRSTFVNKDAREQFEIRRHKRLVEIQEPTAKTLAMLQEISIPSGVGVEIKA
jgi:small subunit ribosomal protein S10